MKSRLMVLFYGDFIGNSDQTKKEKCALVIVLVHTEVSTIELGLRGPAI